MATPFTIDGQTFNVFVPTGGLKRSFQVLDGPNASRVLSGDMRRDLIGTFYNYTVEISTKNTSLAEYDRLYEILSAPVDFHDVTFPYGQDTLSFKAYVTAGEDSVTRISGGHTYWAGLSVQFVAKSPQRT